MKIAIPTEDEKLCSHFNKCETFTFVDVNPKTNEILNIECKVPECGKCTDSACWIAEQGANIVLACGMGSSPMMYFKKNGVKVISGCPELPVKDVVNAYLSNTLKVSNNSCCEDGTCCDENASCGEAACCDEDVCCDDANCCDSDTKDMWCHN